MERKSGERFLTAKAFFREMPVTKKYHPPSCPDLYFFRGNALDTMLEMAESRNPVEIGQYRLGSSMQPVAQRDVSQLVGMKDERTIVVMASQEPIPERHPMVKGMVGIYPQWRYFAISGMRHPVLDSCYFSQIDALTLQHIYGGRTREQQTGETRFEFVGSDRTFDPIERGLATWYAYPSLATDTRTGSALHLMIALTPRRTKEIQAYVRNKGIREYADFLDRIGMVAPQVKEFRQYHDAWAARQARGRQRKAANG